MMCLGRVSEGGGSYGEESATSVLEVGSGWWGQGAGVRGIMELEKVGDKRLCLVMEDCNMCYSWVESVVEQMEEMEVL